MVKVDYLFVCIQGSVGDNGDPGPQGEVVCRQFIYLFDKGLYSNWITLLGLLGNRTSLTFAVVHSYVRRVIHWF